MRGTSVESRSRIRPVGAEADSLREGPQEKQGQQQKQISCDSDSSSGSCLLLGQAWTMHLRARHCEHPRVSHVGPSSGSVRQTALTTEWNITPEVTSIGCAGCLSKKNMVGTRRLELLTSTVSKIINTRKLLKPCAPMATESTQKHSKRLGICVQHPRQHPRRGDKNRFD